MNTSILAPPESLLEAQKVRLAIREGYDRPTAGMANGLTQVNMISVPQDWAYDFLLYTQRNPQSCPVLDVIDAGQFQSRLIQDKQHDIRTDFPRYRIWEYGQCVDEVNDATSIWNNHPDLVTFLIGCSFSFESALLNAGIEVRHITDQRNVPMYLSNIPCASAGRISGNMVVSMRPIPAAQVSQAVQITAKMPRVHGAPVHIGDPKSLGIADLSKPDFGDFPRILDGSYWLIV